MVADRRVTFSGGLLGPYRVEKIARGPGILVAGAGDSFLRTALAEAMAPCTGAGQALHSVARAIRGLPEQIGHVLALTVAHGLVEIDSRGHCHELESDYWSIGSGFQAALGYMAGVLSRAPGGASLREWQRDGATPDLAAEAICFAAGLNADVGDGIQTEVL
jgi:hypothetical protein